MFNAMPDNAIQMMIQSLTNPRMRSYLEPVPIDDFISGIQSDPLKQISVAPVKGMPNAPWPPNTPQFMQNQMPNRAGFINQQQERERGHFGGGPMM